MRRLLKGFLVLGLTALPGLAQAQYAPRYYYPPAYNPGWYSGYSRMPAAYPSPYAQPVPYYVPAPSYSTWQQPATVVRIDSDPLVPPPQPMPSRLPAAAANPTRTPPSTVDTAALLGEATRSGAPELIPIPKGENLNGVPPVDASTAAPLPADKDKDKAPPRLVPTPAPGSVLIVPPPADAGCGADCTECKERKHHPCVDIFADYLYWTVHNADVPYAQPFDGSDVLSVPRGGVGVASPNYSSGFRLGGGFAISEDSWLVGTFTWFREVTGSSIAAPDPDVLHNFLVFPNTVNSAGDSLNASALYTIDLKTADLDYKCAFINHDGWLVSWLAGARYAHLEQSLLATYEIFGTTTIDSRIRFDGGGPRVGLSGEYCIHGGLFGYGQGVLNLLAGRFSSSYTERNVFTGLVGQTTVDSSRIVPITELELGAGWQGCNGHIRISGGYYVGAWFNAVTTTGLASAIEGNVSPLGGHPNFTTNGNNFRDSLIFDGVVGRIEFRY